jgi:benzodiazapine receptor
MTTYIPQLTLPQAVFDSPAISILLPIALGTGVGFLVRRSKTLCLHNVYPPELPIAY